MQFSISLFAIYLKRIVNSFFLSKIIKTTLLKDEKLSEELSIKTVERLKLIVHTFRRNRGPEASEDGKGEGGLSDHCAPRNKHAAQGGIA